jgi:hypothetical protein
MGLAETWPLKVRGLFDDVWNIYFSLLEIKENKSSTDPLHL